MEHRNELKKLKIYTIKKLREMKKKQDLFLEELGKKKAEDDFLTVKELIQQYDISRKTFDRMREKGLSVSQPVRNGKILVQRKEIEEFLTAKY